MASMFIRDAVDVTGVAFGVVPGSNDETAYHVVGTNRGEPVKNKRGEIVEPFVAYTIRWWHETQDTDDEAYERDFELEVEPGGGRVVHWRAGDDDPSGPVTRFVQETLAPELAAAIRGE